MSTIPPVPVVGRTPTEEGLSNDMRALREHLQQFTKAVWPHDQRLAGVESRLAVIEDTTGDEVMQFIREAGARYTQVHAAVASVADRVEELATQLKALASDVRRRLDDHEERLDTVTERAATHEVRLDAMDADALDARLRTVEAHVAGDARELALTKTQQRRLDGRTAAISTVTGALAWVLSKLFGG